MRILLNGIPMVGQATGVGQYSLALLDALRHLGPEEGVEAIGVFDGSQVVHADDFFRSAPASAAPRKRLLIRLIRKLVPSARILRERWKRYRLSSEISRAGWQLYHETNYVPPDLKMPLVTTIHDMGYLRYPQFFPRDRLEWLRVGLQKAMQSVNAIIVDSEFTRQEMLELCPQTPPEKIHTTLLGVDYDRFANPANKAGAEDLRKRHDLPEKFALYLGTLEPRKNLQGLIEAYNLLPSNLQKEFPLVLAGMAGWQQHYFRPQLDALRRRGVLFEIGYVPQSDVPTLLAASSVFCFPSLYEGFGLPPLEAAAAGVPVLSSNAASLPEVMGDAAVYVDPHNLESIVHGLKTIFEDEPLRKRLSVEGQKRAQTFTWKRCARQTLDVYRKAA